LRTLEQRPLSAWGNRIQKLRRNSGPAPYQRRVGRKGRSLQGEGYCAALPDLPEVKTGRRTKTRPRRGEVRRKYRRTKCSGEKTGEAQRGTIRLLWSQKKKKSLRTRTGETESFDGRSSYKTSRMGTGDQVRHAWLEWLKPA